MKQFMERTHHTLITEGVLVEEQTLAPGKPFWVFFILNIAIVTWLMGVLLAGYGFSHMTAALLLLVGGAVGCALPAATALLGPVTRLSALESGRFSFGSTGKRLPALLNWVNAVGWDVINNIFSATALVALLAIFNVAVPFWAALGVLVILQLYIGIYGHHLIQATSKYSSIILGTFFILVGCIAVHTSGLPVAAAAPIAFKDVLSAFVLLVAFNTINAVYAADYTRYVPATTSRWTVFLPVFLGLFLALVLLATFGYLSASLFKDPTPDSILATLQNITGGFAPLVLLLVAFNSIPLNAINDNSAAYSLMSAGLKISRPVAATIGAMVGYVVCLLASNTFIDFFENFLYLAAHWISPWAAILLTHWFMHRHAEAGIPLGIMRGFAIFVVVSLASVLLFAVNSLYTGLLSDAVGGVDVGPYIGFVVAGLLYYLLTKRDGKVCAIT